MLFPDCAYLKPFRMRLIGYLLGGISIYSPSSSLNWHDIILWFIIHSICDLALPQTYCLWQNRFTLLHTLLIFKRNYIYIYIYIYIYNTQTYQSISIYSYVNTFTGVDKLHNSFCSHDNQGFVGHLKKISKGQIWPIKKTYFGHQAPNLKSTII